ncbi:hypothetical protein L2E82_15487 [Cichorium intybus]|uniref:Uncharacterized protein n=1 Tax=Cichorium intybus TaxID=13427 RepID=A0ACB9F2Z0_CICIN|nr:hypothetical protein L2E82_15487 [Cichorium intybus]
MVVKVSFLAASPTRSDRGCSVVVRLMVTMAVTTGDDGDAHDMRLALAFGDENVVSMSVVAAAYKLTH